METLRIENMTIGYGRKVVAEGLTAALHQGQLVALVGRNGVGKSTLIRTLAGFQGEVRTMKNGDGMSKNADKRRAMNCSGIAVVLTERPDVSNLTVSEVVGLGRSPYTGFWGILSHDDKAVVAETLRLVGIEELKNRLMQTLSDGERQKVMVAKALAQQTPVIILDEPTAFLDYPSKVDMMVLLHRMAVEQQKSILLSTHDLDLVMDYADELWLMQRTQPQLLTGKPEALRQSGVLEKELEFKS